MFSSILLSSLPGHVSFSEKARSFLSSQILGKGTLKHILSFLLGAGFSSPFGKEARMDHCSSGDPGAGAAWLSVLCCPWHQLGQSPTKSLGEIPGRNPWEKCRHLRAPHQRRRLLAICSPLTSLGRAKAERKVLSL